LNFTASNTQTHLPRLAPAGPIPALCRRPCAEEKKTKEQVEEKQREKRSETEKREE